MPSLEQKHLGRTHLLVSHSGALSASLTIGAGAVAKEKKAKEKSSVNMEFAYEK